MHPLTKTVTAATERQVTAKTRGTLAPMWGQLGLFSIEAISSFSQQAECRPTYVAELILPQCGHYRGSRFEHEHPGLRPR